VKFDDVTDAIARADLVIVAVSVSRPIVKARELKKALTGRKGSLLVVDISQPRAVEDKVGLLDGVVLRNIEDLEGIIEESIRNREAEAGKARSIAIEELDRFERDQSKLLVEPIISEIFRRVDDIRRKELERAVSKMAESDEKKLAVLDRFSRELVERVLQMPVDQLKQAAMDSDDGLLSAAEKLFKVKS
jgi:glutamyl-tRNA reductase